MTVEDDLKNIKIELRKEPSKEEELKRLRRKKIFVAVTGLFLAVLLVSYLIPGNYILYLVEGHFSSYKLNSDLTIDLKNGGKIIFNETVYEELKQLYFAEQKNEFKVCLQGRKEGANYYIAGLYRPEIFGQSFSHVSAELCDENTIIPLHTHPYKHCIFSLQDIRNYEAVRKKNSDAIIGLMCEVDRFNFYGF